MKAAEKMLRRCELYPKLVDIDQHIALSLGGGPKNRVTASPQALLTTRQRLCADLLEAGFHPWPAPIDINESRAR